tara:strand:- start:234 stop:1508 length:1275 start_codon:yes stop_codon:yes gene_type:complete
MSSFIVEGGHPLNGTIQPAGNKNAALPAIAATILSSESVTLHNIPRILDVETLLEILVSLGAEVVWEDDNIVTVNSSEVVSEKIDKRLAERIRASLLIAGPLLARFGEVELPPPGGDVIGRRRLDTHFLAFDSLGAEVSLNEGFHIKTSGLIGANIFLDEPSVTATENTIMAAVLADGESLLRNVASEPHVQDLCHLLNSMGAHIEGIGTNILRIKGVKELAGTTFAIGRDHIETGSFIGLAAMTMSELTVEKAPIEHLDATLLGFARLGVNVTISGDSITIHGDRRCQVASDAFGAIPKIDDGPWPAFPADLTSIAVVTATRSEGTILIHEKMFESRMYFTDKLVAMGAQIILCDPHRAVVVGPSKLRGMILESPDIRTGMAMLIAALGADGTSRIHNIHQIERGYENIDERLCALGAHIERV